jgi:hypothetical protein
MGTRNPFTVPDGYFDKLADQVIGRLPAESVSAEPADGPVPAVTGKPGKPAAVRYLRPLLYAAACALVLVVSVWLWQSVPDASVATQPAAQLAAQQEQTVDETFDEAADYMMLDNQDIYTYLAEN